MSQQNSQLLLISEKKHFQYGTDTAFASIRYDWKIFTFWHFIFLDKQFPYRAKQ